MLKVRSSLKQKMIVVLMALGVVACGGASTATPRLIRAAPQTVSEAPSARRLRIEKMLPKVRQEVLKTLKANAIPAASFAVLDRGHVAWAHHHGRTAIGGGQPVNARTLYRIGSITKTMAAMSALILSKRGELDLDAPATEYLPELS